MRWGLCSTASILMCALATQPGHAQPCDDLGDGDEPTIRAEERDGKTVYVVGGSIEICEDRPLPQLFFLEPEVELPLPRATEATPQVLAALDATTAVRRFGAAINDSRVDAMEAARADETDASAQRELDAWKKREGTARAMLTKTRSTLLEYLQRYIDDNPDDPAAVVAMHLRIPLLAEQAESSYDDDGDAPVDYTQAIDEAKQLLTRFPDYEDAREVALALAVHTLAGPDPRAALNALLAYVCPNQHASPLAPPPALPTGAEVMAMSQNPTLVDPYATCRPKDADAALIEYAWVRVGGIHFATPGELHAAVSAYTRATASPASKHYDTTIFKLGWTFYRLDMLLEAIGVFDRAIAHADKQPSPESLRDEALQYIAISFTSPWKGEIEMDPMRAMARAKEFYQGRMSEPHVRDVFATLGSAFRDLGAHAQAIESFSIAIDAAPTHAGTPELYALIIATAFDIGDPAQTAARQIGTIEVLARGGQWHTANKDDADAMLARKRVIHLVVTDAVVSLLQAARAQTGDAARQAAHKAVSLCEAFLDEFPASSLAEAIGQVLDAAKDLAP